VALDAGDAGGNTATPSDAGTCGPPPVPALDPTVLGLAPEFASIYTAYDLGAPSGLPSTSATWLMGALVSPSDPATLLVAFENAPVDAAHPVPGQLWSVPLKRDACGHIIGFTGPGVFVRDAPDVRSLAAGPHGLLFSLAAPGNSTWFEVSELLPGQSSSTYTVDLRTVGVDLSQAGNNLAYLGFVPANFQDAGGLRLLAFGASSNNWWHLTYAAQQTWFSIAAATGQTFSPSPGHIAYVPHGSPGFSNDSMLAADEWTGTIDVLDVNSQGDPMPSTRKPFARASGGLSQAKVHFEPQTGDFIVGFNAGNFRLYVVQGFVAPQLL
jgi:hypothetical protein